MGVVIKGKFKQKRLKRKLKKVFDIRYWFLPLLGMFLLTLVYFTIHGR